MRNKKGGYIVEAAVTLPVLIVAVCSLVLIINISMVCEGICFSTADSAIDYIRKPHVNFLSVSLCKLIEKNVLSDESQLTDFKVTNVESITFSEDEQPYALVVARGRFSVNNPIGIDGRITFTEQLLLRPMIGSYKNGTKLFEEDFLSSHRSKKVIVFPKYGEKYHTKDCYYVKREMNNAVCKLEMEKVDAGLKGYEPCLVCGGAAND